MCQNITLLGYRIELVLKLAKGTLGRYLFRALKKFTSRHTFKKVN
jgi:hypothetical protein